MSLLDLVGDDGDHAAVFALEEAAAGGGEDERGVSGMTEDEQLHLAA
ncbi:MAG: hypothetical protein ABI072_09815 [Edaphobacter sp.]